MEHDVVSLLVPPERVPSKDYFVWHTGLVASSRVIAISIVVEPEAAEPVVAERLMERVPIRPNVYVFTAAGELAVSLNVGGEGPHRGNIHMERYETWEPVAGEDVLKIEQDDLGLDYSRPFIIT
jgi:hypothetical protein